MTDFQRCPGAATAPACPEKAAGLALLRAILADLRAHIEQDASAHRRAELERIAGRLARVIERHAPPKGAA